MTGHRLVPLLALTLAVALAACSGDDGRTPSTEPNLDLDDDEVLYADLYPALGRPDRIVLRGRLLIEQTEDLAEIDESTPIGEWAQQEVGDHPIAIELAGTRHEARTDDEGYFRCLVEGAGLPAGDGTFSVGPIGGGPTWGEAAYQVLADDPAPVVATSDIDQTYLVTDFRTKRALLRLVREKSVDKRAFPGAPALYRALAAGGRPVVFVSGSPVFFKRVLETRFRSDGLSPRGLHLKDFKGSLRSLDIESLEQQIAYKLTLLLEQRRALPPTATEILLGDDSEADFVVYHLYRSLLDRRLTAETLLERLTGLEVPATDRERIAGLAADLEPGPGRVAVALIRRTDAPSAEHDLAEWTDDEVLAVDDSLQMALVLHDRGLLPAAAVLDVRGAMIDAGDVAAALDRAAEAAHRAGLFGEASWRLVSE